MTDNNCDTPSCPFKREDSWNEYRKMVLSDIERMENNHKNLSEKLDLKTDIILSKIDSLEDKLLIKIHTNERAISDSVSQIKEIKAKASVLAAIFGTLFGAAVSAVAGWLFR